MLLLYVYAIPQFRTSKADDDELEDIYLVATSAYRAKRKFERFSLQQ